MVTQGIPRVPFRCSCGRPKCPPDRTLFWLGMWALLCLMGLVFVISKAEGWL